jgi:hypothetical protein
MSKWVQVVTMFPQSMHTQGEQKSSRAESFNRSTEVSVLVQAHVLSSIKID